MIAKYLFISIIEEKGAAEKCRCTFLLYLEKWTYFHYNNICYETTEKEARVMGWHAKKL